MTAGPVLFRVRRTRRWLMYRTFRLAAWLHPFDVHVVTTPLVCGACSDIGIRHSIVDCCEHLAANPAFGGRSRG